MIRPSALARRLEIAVEVALFALIAAELWIGVLRSAALYTTP